LILKNYIIYMEQNQNKKAQKKSRRMGRPAGSTRTVRGKRKNRSRLTGDCGGISNQN
jgi:hypothetical protein